MLRAPLSALMVVVLVVPGVAKTWYVGGSGADFSEIQPAIDAASDGDVILVRPGTYQTFTLAKGVIVRASSTPFAVTPVPPSNVVIQNVGPLKRAGVAGMSIVYDPPSYYPKYYVLVEVHACPGEVVLEDVSLTCGDTNVGFYRSDCLLIQDCSNVSITDLDAKRGMSYSRHGAVRVDRSSVRVSEASVNAGTQVDLDGYDGAPGTPAINVTDSFVVISGEDLRGGKGGATIGWGHACGRGGRGGDAVAATNSQILLLGYDDRYEHQARGGDGGKADIYNDCYGGDGGDGFRGAAAFVSNVTLLGGAGGTGPVGNGKPGLPWEGTLTEADVVPYLAMTGNFHAGGAFQLDLDIVAAGGLVFVFADHQGFVTVPGNLGPPLGAIPGGRFVTFYGGHLGALGHASLPLVLPNDPSLRGIPVSAQCAVLLDAGGIVLSNATTHVVAE